MEGSIRSRDNLGHITQKQASAALAVVLGDNQGLFVCINSGWLPLRTSTSLPSKPFLRSSRKQSSKVGNRPRLLTESLTSRRCQHQLLGDAWSNRHCCLFSIGLLPTSPSIREGGKDDRSTRVKFFSNRW